MIRLKNNNGTILIGADVFTLLAGDAATSCFGVKGVAARSVSDGIVHLLKRESMKKGVKVTCNEDSTISVELHIAVDKDINIPVVCESIIKEVEYKITSATGVTVRNVDVFVDSIIVG